MIYSFGMKVVHINAREDEWVRVHRPKPPWNDDLRLKIVVVLVGVWLLVKLLPLLLVGAFAGGFLKALAKKH